MQDFFHPQYVSTYVNKMKDWVITVLENYMDQRDTCGGSKKKKSGSEKVAEMGQIKIILIQI